ncbi:MAG: HEAT repeat domain-containing protein [bacterium]
MSSMACGSGRVGRAGRVGLVLALGVAGCWLGVPSVAQEGLPPPAAQPDASAQPAPVKLTDAEWALRAAAAEKQLRRIRFEHFTKSKPEVRKVGIERLSVFADAPALPALLEVMRDEQDDVRRGVVEHLARLGSDEGLTTLAYAAVHEVDPSFRAMARDKLVSVVRKGRARPAGVDTVIASALEGSEQAQAGRAARLVQSLGILQAIPALIMGQIGGGSGGQSDGGTAIAWILIGNQQGYVADITPIVGDSSVGFDPTPAVLTTGVVLKIGDAAITSYRTEVHQALVEMTSNIAGADTSAMGYDQGKWAQWYRDEFPNVLARRAAAARAEAEAKAKAKAAATDQPGKNP